MTRISATEAARNFSKILTRVQHKGEEFVVVRGGEPACRIIPCRRKKVTTGEEFVRFIDEFVSETGGFTEELEIKVREATRRQPRLQRPKPWPA